MPGCDRSHTPSCSDLGCRTCMHASVCNSVLRVNLQSHCFVLPSLSIATSPHSFFSYHHLLHFSLFPFCYRCILAFWDKVSLYSAGRLGTRCVDQVTPAHRDLPPEFLKLYTTTPSSTTPHPEPLPTTDLYRCFQIKNVTAKQIELHTV